MTREQKRELIYRAQDMGATLDGEPAQVVGVELRFATVRTMDGKQSVEFAWETVQRVLDNGGKFRS